MNKLLLIIVMLFSLSGCQHIADYNYYFREGQPYSEKRLALIKVGQSQEEVLKLLGSTVYNNTFDNNRWYFINHSKNRHGEYTKQFIIEFNAAGRVSQIIRG